MTTLERRWRVTALAIYRGHSVRFKCLRHTIMATITIDGVEHNTDTFSESAKAQVLSLQFVQAELQRLEAQIAVYKTAEAGYAKALQQELGL